MARGRRLPGRASEVYPAERSEDVDVAVAGRPQPDTSSTSDAIGAGATAPQKQRCPPRLYPALQSHTGYTRFYDSPILTPLTFRRMLLFYYLRHT